MSNAQRIAVLVLGMAWLLAVPQSWMGMVPAVGEEPPAPDRPSSSEVSASQIQQWARDLSAKQFLTRETAMEQLIQAGSAAIGPVRQQLAQEAEPTLRGIYILEQLALSGDFEVEEKAREALEQISQGPAASRATRLATASLSSLDQLRQHRTLQYLANLGAQPTRAHRAAGNTIQSYVRDLTVGEEWKGEDKDLKRLRWLGDLESITFEGKHVKDEWFQPLAHMTSLTSVTVKKAPISDDALAVLPKVERLSTLELKYVPIGDDALQHLLQLQNSSNMKLYGTKLSLEATERLRTHLAGVDVDVRRGAFLGVGCHTHALGCQISLVQPGSSADQAGLNSGDVIVRYEDAVVPDFETLTQLISLNAVGDKVSLVAVRQAQIVPFQIRLKSQDEPEGEPDQARNEDVPPAPADPKKAAAATLAEIGITIESHPLGCRITGMKKEKIAYRVGIREGDVIFSCNNTRVADPEAFADALKQAEEDIHALEVARGFDILKKNIELGEWD